MAEEPALTTTDIIPDTPYNDSCEKFLNISLNKYDEQETSVAYSVLVNMPHDIIYDERKIYNCRQDKYLELAVNQQTINKVQTTAVGRSNECMKISSQTKSESSTTGHSTLLTQTSEETCTIRATLLT
jgi:hypothetical protein